MLDAALAQDNLEAIEDRESIGSAPYPMGDDFWNKQAVHHRWLGHYGGTVYGDRQLNTPAIDLFAPEYGLTEIFNLRRANLRSVEHMWDELLTVDLVRQAPVCKSPSSFFWAGTTT